MKSFNATHLVIMLGALLCWTALAHAQAGGIDRRNTYANFGALDGIGGASIEKTCGGTIAANAAVYLDSSGNVQAWAITSQATTGFGVALRACAATATATVPSSTFVQVMGVANVVADAAIAINDLVGEPSSTAGRVKTITTGTNPGQMLGRALSATSNGAGDLIKILLTGAQPPAASAGNTTISGTLAVGNTSITGTLGVTGHTTLEGVTSTGATGTGNLVFDGTPTLNNPVITAGTGTSLLLSGIIDGVAPTPQITTGTTANIGATYKTGMILNQEGTAGTGVTYTLPATATGKYYCAANSGTTGVVNIGAITVYPPASSYVINNGVVNTVGGGGTHGVASGGAAGDMACFLAIDSTHWQVLPLKGTWTSN